MIAGALPADKVSVLRDLQDGGATVAMVGDGINDGAALATADLGLALGLGHRRRDHRRRPDPAPG